MRFELPDLPAADKATIASIDIMNFAQWQSECAADALRFFSLGRHALVAALRAAGIDAGDRVLLPEFICRDVLASLAAVGAEVAWYPVGEDLGPATAPEHWPAARAVLAVNYFGFPQPLAPFRAYAARTGAVLIEDNAHGFLSRDGDGAWLGTRADFGIFSLRKTLPIADGAMLACGAARFSGGLPGQLAETGPGFAPAVALKAAMRRLPACGIAAAAIMTGVARSLRRIRTGHAIAPSAAADELAIPCIAAPHRGLAARLAGLDVPGEIGRRRALYEAATEVAKADGIEPLFPELPAGVAPYGFPFRLRSNHSVDALRRWSKRRGLELIGWPDLPEAIEKSAPDRYRNLHLVNFLC
jgi:hypothetical protein